MNQLGNLAIVCARRANVLLQILDGNATLCVGDGPERKSFVADRRDNARIEQLIYELNFGELAVNKKEALQWKRM
jgi:short-subunit dehydrogenase involved in D-alanine esterification of teichoic acids